MSAEALKNLLKHEPGEDLEDYDELNSLIERVDIEAEKNDENLKKAFKISQTALKNVTRKNRENKIELQEFEKEIQRTTIKMQNYENDMNRLKRELKIFQQEPGNSDKRELQSDIARLESRNDTINNELKELEMKYYQEKSDKEKSETRIEKLEKDLSKYKRDCERYEEDIREYGRQIQTYRDEKYSRTGDEQGLFREKINQKNKVITELEDENAKLLQDSLNLNKLLDQNKQHLQDSTFEMNKTREDIRKLKLLQQHNDGNIEQLKRENDVLKSQVELYNEKLLSHQTQNDDIMSIVEERVKAVQIDIQRKDEEIKQRDDLIIQLNEQLSRAEIDSDKVTVSALAKTIQEKERQIELLKKNCEEYAKEMDKSYAVINNLNKTFDENSKIYSKSSQYNATKAHEQKVFFLEKMLREGEERFNESEKHAVEKERELTELLNRMKEYESGDYQLQQAVDEIKGLKGQIKVRDRDIENLTKNINKLDFTLNEIAEENDELRAKLGMEPGEKLDLEDMDNLKAVRAQESRAIMHVLKREVEGLEEERTKLKQTIRKLAKQLGTKVNVASIIDEDYFYNETHKPGQTKEPPVKVIEKEKEPTKTAKDIQNEQQMKKRNEQLMQVCLDFENENKLLEKGLREIHTEITAMNKNEASIKTGGMKSKSLGKSKEIKCPSLDKLLLEIEQNRTVRSNMKSYAFLNMIDGGSANNVNLAFKSEIDYIQGRNEELRTQLVQVKGELKTAEIKLAKFEDEVDRLNGDVRVMNNNSSAKDIFQPLKLPDGMAPSSQDIISALNEYLIDTLQELDEYKKISMMSEKDLDALKRKYSVARHQISLLYKDYIDESNQWKKEKSNLEATIKKLSDTISTDSVKLQEYNRLLDTLQQDETEIHSRLSESSRQMFALRSREKHLQRKCSALEETDQNLIKENKKLRVEIIEMEIAVQQRIGYLERYKDMANFRIMSLQRQLEESVSITKLETVNREYTEVVTKYRQLLDKSSKEESLTVSLHQTEQLNKKFESELEALRNELEIEKDKCHMLEDNLERLKSMPMNSEFALSSNKGLRMETSHESSILAKRLTAIEMKELNERQRADHAQRMYDEQRNILRQLENRNLDLEANIAQINKNYLRLLKIEQELKDELSQCVSKQVNDADRQRIRELEKDEHLLKLEVSRLRELTEITLYQTSSLEFINNLSKAQLESFGLIDMQVRDPETSDLGKLHREQIMLQISEATAVRKLQQAQQKCKRFEAQLIRAEQKYDRENLDSYNNRKEQISKVAYLRSTIQDLRHKYNGSIPLKQQEAFNSAKVKLSELREELATKIMKINEEKFDLEDRIAEYEARSKQIEMLKNGAVVSADGSSVRFNEKFLDSFTKSENLRMLNLKLERANRRAKDEIRFLEEMNRKHEITIIGLEEDGARLEADYEQKLLVWEHREADLERTCETLKRQQMQIETLALNFEEISGNMPDHTLPISNQLDQAMNIIRSHIKLLAEAKIQSDLTKKKIDDLEKKARTLETDVNTRDKVITELRLRMPASAERDNLIQHSMNDNFITNDLNTPVRAAQSTIESLQARLKQKDMTIMKYQEMLRLAREEINQVNKQNELEINGMIDKLNLTRDTNLQKLKQELKYSSDPSGQVIAASQAQLGRLQELEEVTVEQENSISALQQRNKKLTSEVNTWKARYEMLNQKAATDLANSQLEQQKIIEKLNAEISEFRDRIDRKEDEIEATRHQLDEQRHLNIKSPSTEVKSVVEKLKQQLVEKEAQQRVLNEALNSLKSDMVSIARSNLTSMNDETSYERKIQSIIEKTSAEYQDKLYTVEEDLAKFKRELKLKVKANEELQLELDHLKSQVKSKDQRIKKLGDENFKLIDDNKVVPADKIFYQTSNNNTASEPKANEQIDYLKRQVRVLEDKLKRQKPAERPFEQSRSRSPAKTYEPPEKEIIIRTINTFDQNSESAHALKREMEQWRTRYNFVVNENAVLIQRNKEMEAEIKSFHGRVNVSEKKILQENMALRDELEKLEKSVNVRGSSPSKLSDLRVENKLNREIQSLRKEIDKLQGQNLILMKECERLRNNDDSLSQTSTSSIKRVGQSGKSTTELEKTISLMKKMILKLQHENESLKSNFK